MSKGPIPTMINYYRCPRCKTKWADSWDCACDDDCPNVTCGLRHITPYKSEDIDDDA